MKTCKLCILIPCYNEEEIIKYSSGKLFKILTSLVSKKKILKSSYLCFVDDGSIDKTWELIKEIGKKNKSIKGLKLSRNYGHQSALLAGLLTQKDKSDCVITIDADLQDDVSVIEDMIDEYYKGNSIVYGIRKSRDVDSVFKRFTAQFFYKLLNFLKVKTVYNHADFRLTDKKILNELSKFNEVNLYLRGLFPLIGLKSSSVYYERKKRTAGITKYPFRKMLLFAWDGITSFSFSPMRLILLLGVFIFIISSSFGLWAIILLIIGKSIPGWASTVIPIYFFGGLQLMCIGILGEYIGKIYAETKSRPRYIIDEEV
ncbi:glycosyltransferase family 2 protein [Spirochaetota bacterium]